MGFIWSIIIGIVAGYLAGKIMRGGGFGVIVNLILGIIGGVLGGWVFSPSAVCTLTQFLTKCSLQIKIKCPLKHVLLE